MAGPQRSRGLLRAVMVTALTFSCGVRVRAEEPINEEKVGDSPYSAEFRTRVNEAIDRGVLHLKRNQRGDTWPSPFTRGYPMGPTALTTLTLLKCGVKADDPAVVRAFEFLKTQPLVRTYEVGILLMAIAAKYDPAHETFEPDEVDRYGNVKPKSPCATAISKEDLAWMKRGVEFLVNAQTVDGVWRYPENGVDLSNTQYALLGLQAANRCGSLVATKVWLAALEYLVKNQEVFGRPVMYRGNEVRGRYRFQWNEPALLRGFRYIPGAKGARPSGSMTTAGLASLIICQTELWASRRFDGELRLSTRRGIRDAMAWLQENYEVTCNPFEKPASAPADDEKAPFGREDTWYLYYMYGLERAGILGRFRFLGAHDWYFDGAEALLQRQFPDGGWGPVTDTCFALLFLKRATSRHAAPVITPSESEPSHPPAAPVPGAPRPEAGGEPRGGGADRPAK